MSLQTASVTHPDAGALPVAQRDGVADVTLPSGDGQGPPGLPQRKALVTSGLVWNALYQVVAAIANLASMLVLARTVPPQEYGRAGAVLGILAVLNVFSSSGVIAHALQLPAGQEPCWSRHWSAGFYIQLCLATVCHLVAALCWLLPAYRPVAPLLHLAAFGLLIDFASHLGITRRRRAMDFRRLRTVHMIGTIWTVSVTTILGVAGFGAFAIVLGNNVAAALPFSVDLLFVQKWRPERGWWRPPDWASYRPSLRFGLSQVGSGLLASARGALEAAVLPAALGFAPIGLLNRAQALYSTSVGRVGGVLTDAVYPLLPLSAEDPAQFRRHALLFAQIALLIVVPGALLVGLEGATLSHLVYGRKWAAADPLLWPGALIGLGLSVTAMCSSLLLAASRLRRYVLVSAATAALGAPGLFVAVRGGNVLTYAWALAAGQIAAAAVALGIVSPLLGGRRLQTALTPAFVPASAALAAVLTVRALSTGKSAIQTFAIESVVFGAVVVLCLRLLFPESLAAILSRLPMGRRVQRWLALRVLPASA